MQTQQIVEIDHTNWRGERRKRLVRPIRWFFGSNKWHREEQWLMVAYCLERGEERDFAMSGLHGFTPAAARGAMDTTVMAAL